MKSLSSRKKPPQTKLQKIDTSVERIELGRLNKCPKCGKEIAWVEFSGQTYGGSYAFEIEHTFSFTCPQCHYVIYQVSFRIDQKDLRPTTWMVAEEKKKEAS